MAGSPPERALRVSQLAEDLGAEQLFQVDLGQMAVQRLHLRADLSGRPVLGAAALLQTRLQLCGEKIYLQDYSMFCSPG